MALLPIKLLATDSNWRLFMVRKADSAFLTFQNRVFERDQYTCRYCGFKSKQFLEVINRDCNYLNNRLSNLVTACGFCTQCFFLESVGQGGFGGGVLIYLPEMSQNELNAFCHILFASMAGGKDFNAARNVYRSYKLRTQPIEKQWGEGFSTPALLGRLLIDTHGEAKTVLNAELSESLRLLPDPSRFSSQIQDGLLAALNELTFAEINA